MAKILVVENDLSNAEVIQLILEDQYYEVACINEADLLIDTIQTFGPDLILMDIILNTCDGRDLCNALKENKLTKHIPILLITAMLESQAYAVVNKADAIMFKPFEYHKLKQQISNMLAV
ncbi:PleD family two-component system response regulator [Pedobacter sp. R20-19]|uniref:response regulator n=1 Tax=Pedobacter sp. R20-19 TaxID=1270196 RepID=UPI000493A55C|nr:response regulator [Pedobacter sp. R20-19]